MKLMAMAIFLLTVSIGCCVASYNSSTELFTPMRGNYIEPEFERYVVDFEKLYNVKVDAPMYFESNLDGNKIGECWTFTDNYREIVIEKESWEKDTILRRRSLIFHELAHYYHQDHRNEMYGEGCPKSIMHEKIASQKCLRKYWKEYEKELVGAKSKNILKRLNKKTTSSRLYKTIKPLSKNICYGGRLWP